MLHWDLLTGPLPVVLVVLAVLGGLYLLLRRRLRHWWTVAVPVVAGAAVAGALAITWWVNHIWRPFPDPLPGPVVVWCALMLAGVGLLIATLIRRGAGWRRRVVAVLAAVAIVACCFNEINGAFGYYPTLAQALGQVPGRQIALPSLQAGADPRPGDADPPSVLRKGSASDPTVPGEGAADPPGSLRNWRPTGKLPKIGAISKVMIPGVLSGFHARPGWVYLPPAYLTAHRPELPVLVLIAGQPGSPSDWINGGQVLTTMDTFATHHHGLAPIVVMPDPNGSATANTMCVNSKLGRVDTYLSRDVPRWIGAHLQAERDTARWAVGGFSFGGTCALQLAVAHPGLFPTFLDISGQVAPTLGGKKRTVDVAFGGDTAAYDAVQPLRTLARESRDPVERMALHRMQGTFAVGAHDRVYGPQARTVSAACRRAGMTVHYVTVRGSHNWYVAADALIQSLPQLASRMGLT